MKPFEQLIKKFERLIQESRMSDVNVQTAHEIFERAVTYKLDNLFCLFRHHYFVATHLT